MRYNNPPTEPSTHSSLQINDCYYRRKALIEESNKLIFTPMSKSEMMPKNYGTTIRAYNWIPVLDDRNVNGFGINSEGVVTENGNLYGSSTDVNVIRDALPVLGEMGGVVNKITFTRLDLSATLHKMGFFFEYTQDLLNFDTEANLMEHLNREAMRCAIDIYEMTLQLDLLEGAGVVYYSGNATNHATMTGEADVLPSLVRYKDLGKLSIALDKNKCPSDTKIMKGTTLTDTKVIPSCRWLFCGPDLQTTLEKMVDYHGNPAFIPVEQYAGGTTVHPQEIGKVNKFRIVINQEMANWKGEGAAVVNDGGYYNNGTNYDIYPMLVIGSESFVTIGFQTDGTVGSDKFKSIHKKPGMETANLADDVYGEKGFHSLKWYYGTLILRPERIAVIKTLAQLS